MAPCGLALQVISIDNGTQADIEAVKADYASQRARLAVLLGVEPAAR